MTDQLRTTFHPGHGGAQLAVHRLGAGRPVLLLHGLFSSGHVNWIKYGTAARLAAAGFEAIMPDLRAHGQSEAPHDPEAYPADVLVKDVLALVSGLGLVEYDLVGFSLGSRTAVRGVLAGPCDRRACRPRGGAWWLAGRRPLPLCAHFSPSPRPDPSAVVWRPGDHVLVGRALAQRRLCHVL